MAAAELWYMYLKVYWAVSSLFLNIVQSVTTDLKYIHAIGLFRFQINITMQTTPLKPSCNNNLDSLLIFVVTVTNNISMFFLGFSIGEKGLQHIILTDLQVRLLTCWMRRLKLSTTTHCSKMIKKRLLSEILCCHIENGAHLP